MLSFRTPNTAIGELSTWDQTSFSFTVKAGFLLAAQSEDSRLATYTTLCSSRRIGVNECNEGFTLPTLRNKLTSFPVISPILDKRLRDGFCRPGFIAPSYFASLMAGGFHVPSMIDGGVSF